METISNVIPEPNSAFWDVITTPNFTLENAHEIYNYGFKDGLSENEKIVREKIKRSIDRAANDTFRLIFKMKEKGLAYEKAYLRVRSPIHIDILVLVNPEEILSPEFINFYNFVGAFEKECADEAYQIRFSFLGYSEKTDLKKIVTDGYGLEFKEVRPN